MSTHDSKHSTARPLGGRVSQEHHNDPYRAREKLPEPTVCHGCHAVYHKGRWQWCALPEQAHETLCPACQRTRDRAPAGVLSVSGNFFARHADEIRSLIEHRAERARAEHPLQRLMTLDARPDALTATFTDAHLARGAGEALYDAYRGELDYQYAPDDLHLDVRWHRD
jgi:hypothetical protein